MITCERFMTTRLIRKASLRDRTGKRTLVIDVLVACIAVSEGCNMQIRCKSLG